MKQRFGFVAGMVAGAGIMYILDPKAGSRRRALMRDQMVSAGHTLDETASGKARFAKDKAHGIYAETKSALRDEEQVDDHTLEDRVRSELGRVASNMGSIHVSAVDGRITLHGSAPQDEVDKIVSAAKDVRGVQGVDSKLNPQEHLAEGR
jgi:osmotically-inducible protein OsmY